MTPADHARALHPDAVPHPILQTLLGAGTTSDPELYARGFHAVFRELDSLDHTLSGQRFLGGSEPDARDWGLFAVLVRFDAVHYGLHKLNRTRLDDFENLGPWLRDLYQRPGISETIDLGAVKREAWVRDPLLNPSGTVPVGSPDLWAPHDRWRFDAAERRSAGLEEQGSARFEGEFVRGRSGFRSWLSADPSSDFPAVPGRYHLYVANNCPWCHRVALVRAILGLQDVISLDTVWYRRDPERGWQFRPDLPEFGPDTVNGVRFVRELYEGLGSDEKSVPILWDKERRTIVNNESGEIVRMIDRAFRDQASHPSLCPPELEDRIDAMNAWIYRDINNGAYKAGFSGSQQAYELAFDRFFAALDRLDRILADQPWLLGDRFTEADLRLFPTIFRFDHVYYVRMKLNLRFVRDLPNLQRWHDAVLAIPGVAEASNLEHCKQGYFGRTGNEIVPLGPDFRF